MKEYVLVGACGASCGLCPFHHKEGKEFCGGCGSATRIKKGCPILQCCLSHGFETCGECEKYPCDNYKNEILVRTTIPHKKARENLEFIRKHGLEEAWNEEKKRIRLLEKMLVGFDDGNLLNFCCLAASMLSTHGLEKAIERARNEATHYHVAQEQKARILKKFIERAGVGEGLKEVFS